MGVVRVYRSMDMGRAHLSRDRPDVDSECVQYHGPTIY
jgi:hypothetical protein